MSDLCETKNCFGDALEDDTVCICCLFGITEDE